MEGPDVSPSQTSNPGSDVTSTASSGESDGDSYYYGSRKNLPMSSSRTPELEGHTHELQQMHKVPAVDIEEFTQPTELFTHPYEFNPTDISDNNTTPDENNRYNGASLPHDTQPSSPHSLLTNALVASELPSLPPCVDSNNSA